MLGRRGLSRRRLGGRNARLSRTRRLRLPAHIIRVADRLWRTRRECRQTYQDSETVHHVRLGAKLVPLVPLGSIGCYCKGVARR
jgi:hypothetical protein